MNGTFRPWRWFHRILIVGLISYSCPFDHRTITGYRPSQLVTTVTIITTIILLLFYYTIIILLYYYPFIQTLSLSARKMKSIIKLRGVQATSRRQLRDSFQERLSNRCHRLCQENAQLKVKLAEEKNNSVSLKRLTVQLCQDSAEARDFVAQDKLLQDKLDRINKEISQRYEISFLCHSVIFYCSVTCQFLPIQYRFRFNIDLNALISTQ